MRLLTAVLLLLFMNPVYSQEKGIHFEQGPSWDSIKNKAQIENKGIFVDCYATWCYWCKKMDKEVFTDSIVGEFLNSRFISVKLQMDSSGSDNELVKSWYSTAKQFALNYKFKGYPAYLFFSSKGELLHRGTGFKKTKDFISLSIDAQDSTKQYCRRIYAFKANYLRFDELPDLVRQANSVGDQSMANEIGRYYKAHFLDTTSEATLLSNKNVEFLLSNSELVNSGDRFFKYCLNQPELFDSLHKGMVINFVNQIITREEITNKIWNHDTIVTLTPNWPGMYSEITKKYGKSYAENLLPGPQLDFYSRTSNYIAYAQIVESQISKNKMVAGDAKYAWKINDYAWFLFLTCKDKKILLKALIWSNQSINSMGNSYSEIHNFYDTRANIKYKIGMKQKALVDEQIAIDLAKQYKSGLMNAYIETKSKMEKGMPTWD